MSSHKKQTVGRKYREKLKECRELKKEVSALEKQLYGATRDIHCVAFYLSLKLPELVNLSECYGRYNGQWDNFLQDLEKISERDLFSDSEDMRRHLENSDGLRGVKAMIEQERKYGIRLPELPKLVKEYGAEIRSVDELIEDYRNR